MSDSPDQSAIQGKCVSHCYSLGVAPRSGLAAAIASAASAVAKEQITLELSHFGNDACHGRNSTYSIDPMHVYFFSLSAQTAGVVRPSFQKIQSC